MTTFKFYLMIKFNLHHFRIIKFRKMISFKFFELSLNVLCEMEHNTKFIMDKDVTCKIKA